MSSLIISQEERKKLDRLMRKEVVICTDHPEDSRENKLRWEGDIFLKGHLSELNFDDRTGELISIFILGSYYPYNPKNREKFEIQLIGEKRPRVPRFDQAVFFEGKKLFKGNVWQIKKV